MGYMMQPRCGRRMTAVIFMPVLFRHPASGVCLVLYRDYPEFRRATLPALIPSRLRCFDLLVWGILVSVCRVVVDLEFGGDGFFDVRFVRTLPDSRRELGKVRSGGTPHPARLEPCAPRRKSFCTGVPSRNNAPRGKSAASPVLSHRARRSRSTISWLRLYLISFSSIFSGS